MHKKYVTITMKNLGEYQDLYNMTDVLLLHDDFENVRKIILNKYDLDPLSFVMLQCNNS